MSLPLFYIEQLLPGLKEIELHEDSSRHIIQVLRMKKGDRLMLTDGKGNKVKGSIEVEHKKHTIVTSDEFSFVPRPLPEITIGISVLKNSERFEWFLEKATELGVNRIYPLLCQRTEKEKFRMDRMRGICISAMLQSQQFWLPVLHAPTRFSAILSEPGEQVGKFIAHCSDGYKTDLMSTISNYNSDRIILIGPEGDFTKEEIEEALKNHFLPVSLGNNRLRTETAGLTAAVILKSILRS